MELFSIRIQRTFQLVSTKMDILLIEELALNYHREMLCYGHME